MQNMIDPALLQFSREDLYESIIPQVAFLFEQETDLTANLSNTIAVFKTTPLPYFWVGFYIVRDNQLVLGPFCGLPATSRIDFGKGVCGTAWKEKKTQLVPDVKLFPGHIACNCYSQSEIVVPIIKDGEVLAVLDVDSDQLNDFSELDAKYLEKLAKILAKNWK